MHIHAKIWDSSFNYGPSLAFKLVCSNLKIFHNKKNHEVDFIPYIRHLAFIGNVRLFLVDMNVYTSVCPLWSASMYISVRLSVLSSVRPILVEILKYNKSYDN